MNVIIANKYKNMLKSLNIEVIKSMEGVFNVDDLINTFSNFYYEKMILDITAINNYTDLDNLQKLSVNLDMNKVILILDDNSESESSAYLSKLVSMGIYNFTRNVDGINYLLAHPNTFKDVSALQNVGASDAVQTVNPVNPMSPANNPVQNPVNDTTEMLNRNTNTNVVTGKTTTSKVNIIGIKNLTEHAGATTLVYLLKKHLQSNYSVAAIEVNKTDFVFYNDDSMISTNASELPVQLMKKTNYDIILLDLNDYNKLDVCDDVLYLLEPSLLKLNRLVRTNRNVFEKYKNNKLILNKSFIEGKDLDIFEKEANMKMFYNLPCLDDRQVPNSNINGLLYKLNLKRKTGDAGGAKGGLFGKFKK